MGCKTGGKVIPVENESPPQVTAPQLSSQPSRQGEQAADPEGSDSGASGGISLGENEGKGLAE